MATIKIVITLLAGISFGAVSCFAADFEALGEFQGPVFWKVGDHLEYQMTVGILGKIGTMEKDVTREEGQGVWMKQVTVLTGGKRDQMEFLVNRADGKVLKFLKNGQPADYAEQPLHDISETDESVTVPAGTFQSHHLAGASESGARIEIWKNADATAIDGVIKTTIDAATDIELTRFSRSK